MLTPLLASVLSVAGSLGATPLEPTAPPSSPTAPPPSLTATLAAAAAPRPAPPQAGYDFGLAPTGWVSFGVSFYSTEIDVETDGDPDDDTGIGAEIGLYGWQGEMGLGLEVGLNHSTYEAVADDQLNNPTEEVDVWRGTLGVRLADRGSGDRFLPWLRAGFLYRFDDSSGKDSLGRSLADDGPGFYIGGGFDFVLLGGLALSPQVVYQKSRSVDSEEWIGTVSLTYLF